MPILDLYPLQGTFHPGQAVRLAAEIELSGPAELVVTFWRLANLAGELRVPLTAANRRQTITLEWQPPQAAPAGYGVLARLVGPGEAESEPACSAFDILPAWTSFPRYGYLSDFSPGREDAEQVMAALARYHINGLQFYDWQYRHDTLLAPEREYLDPLGRPLSLDTVERLIAAAHARNIAALPYLAIYAASAAFWRQHPDWALYDAEGQAIPFGEDFLGLMDPTPGGQWAAHLLDECARTLAGLPFDGLHIDQYGEPKTAWDAAGRPVDLPAAFAGFISAAKDRFPGRPVLFNAVGNWPIADLAHSPADFEYIEIWPPDVTYADVVRIVAEARGLSGGRPVAIALYLPADRPANVLLADALILANGGGRIELGEGLRLLADPYFPKHQAIPPELAAGLRRLYDFAVRYGEWVGPQAQAAPEVRVEAGPAAWSIARRNGEWLALHLVNRLGLGDTPGWDRAHSLPQPQADLAVTVELDACPRRVLWTCPERPADLPVALDFEYSNGRLAFRLPALELWGVAALELP